MLTLPKTAILGREGFVCSACPGFTPTTLLSAAARPSRTAAGRHRPLPPGAPRGRSVQLGDDRGVVRGALALALLPVDPRTGHPVGQRRGAEQEVDPHALLLREGQALVVPEGVDAGAGGVRADHVGE